MVVDVKILFEKSGCNKIDSIGNRKQEKPYEIAIFTFSNLSFSSTGGG